MNLTPYLDDLEQRICPQTEEDVCRQWLDFWEGEHSVSTPFTATRVPAAPPAVEWPPYTVNAALDDFDQMALQQLSVVSSLLSETAGWVLNVRANYGTGLLPSLFGAEMFIMDPALNTLPTSRFLPGGATTIRRLLDVGGPDLHNGYGDRCLQMGSFYKQIFAGYPKISKYIHIYHPDLQGPLDVCELLWGSDLFVELVDQPDLVKAFLQLITETYIRFLHEWDRMVDTPASSAYAPHWGLWHRGHIMLRNDSAMNLSPDMVAEFSVPYDQQLLTEFGGGAMHYCGRGDHFIHHLAHLQGLFAINLSQPHLNDMELIFRHTIDRGIKLLNLRHEWGAPVNPLTSGRPNLGHIHSQKPPPLTEKC